MLSNKTGVPAELLRPHLEHFARTFENGLETEMSRGRAQVEQIKCVGPWEFLAGRVGCSARTLMNMANPKQYGSGRCVHFDLADKILCAMDRVQLWRQDPELSEVYQRIDLEHLDKINPPYNLAEAA